MAGILLLLIAVFVLVARVGSNSLAWLAAAAVLAPFQEIVWLLLVRPDAHVAWRSMRAVEDPSAELARVIETLLGALERIQ